MINLYSSVQSVIHSLLNCNRDEMTLFSNNENLTSLFCDLICMGCDFHELLRVFCHNDGLELLNARKVQELLPQPDGTCTVGEKDIRRMILHWTTSKYHTNSIHVIVPEIACHVSNRELGIYPYYSNKNPNNKKAANDIYVLFVMENTTVFADLNRKRSYRFQEVEYDQNSSVRRQPI